MRSFFIAMAISTLWLPLAWGAEADTDTSHPFDRAWLEAEASRLSELPFEEKTLASDNPLRRLSYDQYQAIELQRGAAIWSREDRNFRVSLMHPGFIFPTPVNLNLVVGGVSRRIRYTTEIFEYGNNDESASEVEATGYSGLQLLTEINEPGVWDEFLVFQGASYFRALGMNNWYGISARGLALNTAEPGGEEFPAFTDLWVERPEPGQKFIVIHALLDSESVTGAFTFTATPGQTTSIEVEATLFPREDLDVFGVAPLTSMFFYDATNRSRFDDFRPAVHDSNGLFIETEDGERIWRPLANPNGLQVASFGSSAINAFGLLQRRREFSDFEDIGAHYESRPSVIVVPEGSWPDGFVKLIEIPTDSETHDNIVAFWELDQAPASGEETHLHYTVYWGTELPDEREPGRIESTLAGTSPADRSIREFAIDFAADRIPENLQPQLSISAGEIVDVRGLLVEATGNYRVIIKFQPHGADLAELRLTLKQDNESWGETWLYRWIR